MLFRIKNKNVSNRSFFSGFSTEFTLFQFLLAYADQLELLYNSYTFLVLLGIILIMPYLFFGENKAEGSSVAVINTPQISGCIPPEKDPKKDKKPEGEKETSLQYYLKVTGFLVVGVVVIFGIYYYGPAIAAVFSSFTGVLSHNNVSMRKNCTRNYVKKPRVKNKRMKWIVNIMKWRHCVNRRLKWMRCLKSLNIMKWRHCVNRMLKWVVNIMM